MYISAAIYYVGIKTKPTGYYGGFIKEICGNSFTGNPRNGRLPLLFLLGQSNFMTIILE